MNAIVLGTPTSREVELLDVTVPTGGSVELLGHDGALPTRATASGTVVELPGRPSLAPALSLRISQG